MVKKLWGFYQRLVCHPVPLVFGVLFLAAKVWSNVSYGGSLANGLRSGLVGILVYALALGLIHVLSEKPLGDRLAAQKLETGQAKWGAAITVIVYLFILGSIVDRLQRQGY
ncbi:MAG TPA: hypothetical protein DCL99_02860, partial [Firmicutes bacterium]|nr:hypothetical protein [Bacillota bacterium]